MTNQTCSLFDVLNKPLTKVELVWNVGTDLEMVKENMTSYFQNNIAVTLIMY